MAFNAEKHGRRAIRLKGHDYTAGAYFVTICVQDRQCLFGQIADGIVSPSDAGRMIQRTWEEMPQQYGGIGIDAFQVMPNHIHGIIIVGAGPCACPNDGAISLMDAVGCFKSLTMKRYADGVKENGWPLFHGRLWQRNYYESIIRSDSSFHRIRQYILNNSKSWDADKLHL